MTKAETPAPMPEMPPTPATRATGGRGLKIALAVSLALNLAVVGLVAGAWARNARSGGLPQDLSFGPFSEALSIEDRRALRKALIDRGPGLRETRAAARAEFATLLQTLRATPFDPAATQSALAAIEARVAGRLDLGRSLIEERIAGMSEAERLAFADRLEDGLRRRPRD